MGGGEHCNQLFGNYKLQELLGRGGFAEVYLGEHIHLGTRAAIKVLYNRLAAEDIENFKNEARTIARLIHPHIVRVLDFGIEGNLPFLVMDYAPGGSLRTLHPKGSWVPLPIVVSYVRQIAQALQYAHSQRVIHRDIKPDNMLLDAHSRIMLSDFGMALIAQSSRHQSHQEIAGTAAYMAPEQFQGKTRRRSDQYALAIVVYEWLCGDRPFHGSFVEVASQHFFTPPPSLCARVPHLPVQVEQVIFQALAKDPLQRFENMRDFAMALEEAARSAERPQILSQDHLGRTAPQRIVRPSQPGLRPTVPLKKENGARPSQPDQQSANHDKTDPDSFARLQSIRPSPPEKLMQPPPEKLIRPRARVGDDKTANEVPSQRKLPPKTTDAIVAQEKPLPPPAQQPRLGQPTPSMPFLRLFGQRLLPEQKSQPLSRRTLLLRSGATGLLIATGIIWRVIASVSQQQGTLIYSYARHTKAVNSVSWSPDGKRIASGGVDNTVQIWDAATGDHSITNPGHQDNVTGVAWSSDGGRVASCSLDKTICIWDANVSVGHISQYTVPVSPVYAVAWSPINRSSFFAAAYQDTTVKVWNADTSTNTSTYREHTNAVWAVAWSPDSMSVASGGDDTNLQIWDANSGRKNISTGIGHTGRITSISWSPDGKLVASSSIDHTIRIWNPHTGTNIATYAHSNDVTSVAWSPDGRFIASSSADKTVKIWDAVTGNILYTYRNHTQQVNAVAWSPNGTMIASASSDATVQVWRAF